MLWESNKTTNYCLSSLLSYSCNIVSTVVCLKGFTARPTLSQHKTAGDNDTDDHSPLADEEEEMDYKESKRKKLRNNNQECQFFYEFSSLWR